MEEVSPMGTGSKGGVPKRRLRRRKKNDFSRRAIDCVHRRRRLLRELTSAKTHVDSSRHLIGCGNGAAAAATAAPMFTFCTRLASRGAGQFDAAAADNQSASRSPIMTDSLATPEKKSPVTSRTRLPFKIDDEQRQSACPSGADWPAAAAT